MKPHYKEKDDPFWVMYSKIMIIVLFAFTLRLWHIVAFNPITIQPEKDAYKKYPYSVLFSGDALSYQQRASDIIEGKGYNVPFQPPGYAAFLAIIYLLTGVNLFGAKLIGAVLGTITAVLVYLGGRYIVGKDAAFLAGFFTALSFGQGILAGSLNSEVLYSLLLIIVFYIMAKLPERTTKIGCIVLGFIMGITALVRSEFVLVGALMLIWLFFHVRFSIKDRIRYLVLIAIGSIAVIAPWTVRNYFYMKEYNKRHGTEITVFIPISLNGPLNFFIGNNPKASGGFDRQAFGKIFNIKPEKGDIFKPFKYGYRMGADYISKNFGEFVLLAKRKLYYFLDGFRHGFFISNIPSGLNGYIREGDVFIPLGESFKWIMVALMLCGMVFCFIMRRSTMLLIVAVILGTCLVNILFFGLARSALAIFTMFYLLIAFPIAALARWLVREYAQEALIIFILLVIGIFVVEYLTYGDCILMRVTKGTDPSLIPIAFYKP